MVFRAGRRSAVLLLPIACPFNGLVVRAGVRLRVCTLCIISGQARKGGFKDTARVLCDSR